VWAQLQQFCEARGRERVLESDGEDERADREATDEDESADEDDFTVIHPQAALHWTIVWDLISYVCGVCGYLWVWG
jgi:hypothetical protein